MEIEDDVMMEKVWNSSQGRTYHKLCGQLNVRVLTVSYIIAVIL